MTNWCRPSTDYSRTPTADLPQRRIQIRSTQPAHAANELVELAGVSAVLHGCRLRPQANLGRLAGVNGQVVDEFMSTGAIVAGRGTFEPAGGWAGDHHDGVPIFILSRREPDRQTGHWPLVSYVDDVSTAAGTSRADRG
jgi:hypothetical protein